MENHLSPDLRPDSSEFLVVKKLSTGPLTTGNVFLCLPKKPDNNFISKNTSEHQDQEISSSANPPAAESDSHVWSHVHHHQLQQPGLSTLRDEHLRLLPQLVIVKLKSEVQAVRQEANFIRSLHVQDDEWAAMRIGTWLTEERTTTTDSSPYLTFRPIYGPTLVQFGTRCVEASHQALPSAHVGIPTWFVWHIYIGLVDAVAHLHDMGLVHNDIRPSNIMLSIYPTHTLKQYRDYPDILLVDFSASGPFEEVDQENDVKGIIRVLLDAINRWSECAFFGEHEGLSRRDRLAQFEQHLWDSKWSARGLNIADLRTVWYPYGIDDRNLGPQQLPRWIKELLHSDLATVDELDGALLMTKHPKVVSE